MKMRIVTLASALTMALTAAPALAQAPLAPKDQFAADSKKALTRYEDDKKLCSDEPSSGARLQCRRDAKAEYDKALASARAQMAAATPAPANAKPLATPAPCPDCAKVLAVSVGEKAGEGGAVGLIAGGVTGALLGRQVGGGSGKDLATIAGAVGGAYAGKKIEEKVKTHKVWTVSVQYTDGRKSSFDFEQDPGLKVGDPVKNSGNTIVRN